MEIWRSRFTAASSGKLHTADMGEEEAKKTQNLGLSDVQRCARAHIGFFALSLMDLSLGTALSLQVLCPADKTRYHILSQSCPCMTLPVNIIIIIIIMRV